MTSNSAGATVAEALGVILQRDFRTGLYRHLTAGVHEAVDSAAYPILSGLDRYGPSTTAALGQGVGLDRSIVSRRAARLIAAGLVRATPHPSDARAALLTLTQDGAAIVSTMRRRLSSAIEQHLSGWDESDRDTFAALLYRFAANGPLAPTVL